MVKDISKVGTSVPLKTLSIFIQINIFYSFCIHHFSIKGLHPQHTEVISLQKTIS